MRYEVAFEEADEYSCGTYAVDGKCGQDLYGRRGRVGGLEKVAVKARDVGSWEIHDRLQRAGQTVWAGYRTLRVSRFRPGIGVVAVVIYSEVYMDASG